MSGRGARAVVVASLLGAVVLAGCGGSSKSNSASDTSTSEGSATSSGSGESTTSAAADSTTTGVPNGPFDQCLVGTWKSTSVKASFPYQDGKVEVEGGVGELLTIKADGSFVTDLSNVTPLTGSAAGASWKITGAGKATGHANTAGGKVSETYDDPNALTTTIIKDGTTLASVHGQSTTDTYQCQAGARLTTVGENSTTEYVPAG
ncbi:MAG: hypothetical protein ACYDAD_08840 [Acidimicrobiales bacterium]